MRTTISLHDLRFRGPHGVHPEEAVLGGEYVVHVHCALRERSTPVADDLAATLDYTALYALVAEVMARRAALIETLAEDVVARVRKTFPTLVTGVEVEIRKLHPPIAGRVGAAAVRLRWGAEV